MNANALNASTRTRMTGRAPYSLPATPATDRSPRRGRLRRFLIGGFLASVILAGLFFGGFILFSEHVSGLKSPVVTGKTDGVIVLTGGQYRIEAATELLMLGIARRMLISGVNPDTSL